MKENDIKELAEQMEQGIEAAYEKMYFETSKGVFFICMSFLHNEEDSKDVMQETYLTAYNKISQLKEKEKFVPWLNQIAVNKCKEVLRKKAPVLVDEDDLENAVREENENFLPEEYITNKEKRKIVMDIMRDKLSDIQYRTVILYYFNRLNVEEIADIMECPPGTVKYRLSVARAKIRDGVMEYEKQTKDKLYSFTGIPFLISLFAMEVETISVPGDVWKNIKEKLNLPEKISSKEGTNQNRKEKYQENGKKNLLPVGKGRIAVVLLVSLLVIGAGVGIAIGISKNNDKDEVNVVNQENRENESENSMDSDESDENVEQEEMVLHQAFHEQIRWMTSHNFATGQLESAPEGVVLFPNSDKPLTVPVSFDSFSVPEEESGTILEPGKSMNIWVDEYENFLLNVINMSDSEKTVDECLSNGWASITADGYAHISGDDYFAEMFGYSAELSDTNAYLDMLVETYGSPTYVDVSMTSGSIDEGLSNAYDNVVNGNINTYIGADVAQYLESAAVYEPGEYEVLTLAWEFEEYVILLKIYDSSTKKDTGEIYPHVNAVNYHTYYTRERWDYILAGDSVMYGENVIDQIYPEGMVLPEK